jgi:hypothetical protein
MTDDEIAAVAIALQSLGNRAAPPVTESTWLMVARREAVGIE